MKSIFQHLQHHPAPPVLHRSHCCPIATFMGLAGHSHVLWCFWLTQGPCSITLIPEEMQHSSTSFSFLIILTSLLAVAQQVCSMGWLASWEEPSGGRR